MTYFNTTHATDETLRRYEEKADSQSQIIFDYLRKNKEFGFTPEELGAIFPAGTPITSIRRALTNLTNQGLIIKTVTKRKSKYGRFAHCWKF